MRGEAVLAGYLRERYVKKRPKLPIKEPCISDKIALYIPKKSSTSGFKRALHYPEERPTSVIKEPYIIDKRALHQ